MLEKQWISGAKFAQIAKFKPRTARYHLSRAAEGKPTREYPMIVVRRVHGRGGKSGFQYEVLCDSLPLQFQGVVSTALEPSKKPFKTTPVAPKDPKSWPLAKERYAIIERAIEQPAGSLERTEEIVAAAERSGKGKRTLERYISGYEREGMAGLMRTRPANHGKPRVVVSEIFNAAFLGAGNDPAVLREMGAYATLMLRSLWATRAADGGWRDLGSLAEFKLLQECERRGIDLPASACILSRRRVEKDRQAFEKLNIMRTDAKRGADEQPRISRSYQNVDAMEIVFIDVHHMDVCVTDADGATRWPKIVAFMDAGTGRVFPHFVLCRPGEGIRQEHVIEGFIAMVTHREWGFPRNLYFDNGSENGALDRMGPALSILKGVIVRSIAYNAPAKPIEPLFKRLNQYCFKKMPGYAGGNRMVKKTQNVGKETKPYAGTWEQFKQTCNNLIAYYHQREMRGQWGGRSPYKVFQDKIDAGWRAIAVLPLELDAAFCDRRSYKLSRGALRINGSGFTHDALLSQPHGASINVALPWRRGADPVALLEGIGPVQLVPDYAYAPLDRSGAIASGKRKQIAKRAKRALLAETVPVDPVEIATDIAARATRPVLTGRAYVLDQGAAVQSLADANLIAAQSHQSELTEAKRAKQIRDRRTENYFRRQSDAA